MCLLLLNLAYFGYEYTQPQANQPARINSFNAADQKVELVSERDSVELLELRNTMLTEAISNPVVTNSGLSETEVSEQVVSTCAALGPFGSIEDGEIIKDQLASVDLKVALKAVDELTGNRDYRVMLPPASSAEQAFRKLRELQSQDIDSYVIMRGRNALGISLGVFSGEERALQLQSVLTKKGYETQISPIDRYRRAFWLFTTSQQVQISTPIMTSIHEINDAVRLEEKPCAQIDE